MPMNFSVIGASGGGGGGPVGTAGALTGAGGCTGAGGGGGGAFGLKRNRFRSVSGFGRSAFSASRCTSGPAAAPGAAGVFCPRLPGVAAAAAAGLDAAGGALDVAGHIIRAITATSTTASVPRISRRLRSVAIGRQTVIRGQLHRQQERSGRIALGQRHVIDDHERPGALEGINELPEVFVVPLPDRVHLQQSEARILF